MNAHDLLQAFSEIDPAFLREAQRRAESPDYEYTSFSQEREVTMKHTFKRIIAGMTVVAAACAVVIGAGVYMDRNTGYTVQSSDYPVEPVTGTDTSSAEGTLSPDLQMLSDVRADLTVGQHVQLGDYEWRVLEVHENRALLLTEYGIDCRPFNDTEDNSWENCSLRKWLNSDFYNSFSEEDRALMLTVTNQTNQYDNVGGDPRYVDNIVTEDIFFCLTASEKDYYANYEPALDGLLCMPTQTAIDKGVYIEDEGTGYCTWWLRSPYYDKVTIALDNWSWWMVKPDGTGLIDGKDFDFSPAVRPAVWVQTREPELPPTVPLSDALPDLVPKQHVLFGEYEWRVLDVQDGRALLITEYGIDCRPYNDELVDVTWEICSLRKWLNGEFYDSFNEEERARILTVTNETPDVFVETTGAGPSYTVEGGNDTEDTFFCLSEDEARSYFHVTHEYDAEEILCTPMQTAIDNGVYLEDGHCTWWLRSPSWLGNTRAAVGDSSVFGIYDDFTAVSSYGWFVDNSSISYDDEVICYRPAVRPAVWVSTE